MNIYIIKIIKNKKKYIKIIYKNSIESIKILKKKKKKKKKKK